MSTRDTGAPAPRRRGLGLWMATALVIGNMIGSGIFLLPSSLAKFGGISIVGWLFTAAGALLLAVVFARLGRAFPQTGGPYAYARRAFGDFTGFLTAWGYWIAVWVGNAARSRSILGRLVLSLAVFGVGVVALVDVAGARVPASRYLAVPLAVVAAGLIVGAWYGRARGLIGLGLVLSVLLAITLAANGGGWTGGHQSVTWRPTGIEQVRSSYSIDTGNAVLDLSSLDLSGYSSQAVDRAAGSQRGGRLYRGAVLHTGGRLHLRQAWHQAR